MAIIAAAFVVGMASFYLGWFDRKHQREVQDASELVISRRAMSKPRSMILLALLNVLSLYALFAIPTPDRTHVFTYILSYAGFVLLFYFINYNLGVRYIERWNEHTHSFEKPKRLVQFLGLVYDSAYEMTLLISPAYWLSYYFGFFHL